jgi:hypothetical protein
MYENEEKTGTSQGLESEHPYTCECIDAGLRMGSWKSVNRRLYEDRQAKC